MDTLRITATVAAKELRQRIRDRSALFTAFVAPFLLAVIISAGLGGNIGSFHTHFVVADLDHGAISAAFVSALHAGPVRGVASVTNATDASAARAAVRDGDAGAAFVIPSGLSAAVQSGGRATIDVVGSRSDPISEQVATAIASGFADRVGAVAVAIGTAVATGASTPADIPALAARAGAAAPMVTLTDVAQRDGFRPGTYFGPGMAVFFLFFTASSLMRGVLAERESGTLARLLVAPIPRATVILGKAAATFVTGTVAMATIVIASQLLLGARWGDPLAVAVLCIATVAAVMGLAALVGTLARTQEQANSYASMVGLVLALLGGNFIPGGPSVLRRISLFTPNGWALRAFADLTGHQHLGAITTNLVVLGGIALVTGTAASLRARRIVTA